MVNVISVLNFIREILPAACSVCVCMCVVRWAGVCCSLSRGHHSRRHPGGRAVWRGRPGWTWSRRTPARCVASCHDVAVACTTWSSWWCWRWRPVLWRRWWRWESRRRQTRSGHTHSCTERCQLPTVHTMHYDIAYHCATTTRPQLIAQQNDIPQPTAVRLVQYRWCSHLANACEAASVTWPRWPVDSTQ